KAPTNVPANTAAGRIADLSSAEHLTSVAGAATSGWVAAAVTTHEQVPTPVTLLSAVADPSVFAGGPTAAAQELVGAELRATVLAAVGTERLGPATLPLGPPAGPLSVELAADGLR